MALSIPLEYKQVLNRSIWSIDGTLTGNTKPESQSGPGSNSNQGLPYALPSSKTGTSPSNAVSYNVKDAPFV